MKQRIDEKRDEELVYTKKNKIMQRVVGVISFVVIYFEIERLTDQILTALSSLF